MNRADRRAPGYEGLVTRGIAFAIDAAVIDLVALVVAVGMALVLSLVPISNTEQATMVAAGAAAFLIWTLAYFVTFWSTPACRHDRSRGRAAVRLLARSAAP